MVDKVLYMLNFEVVVKNKYPLLISYYDSDKARFCFPESELVDEVKGTVNDGLVSQIFKFMQEYKWGMRLETDGGTYFYLSEIKNV